MDKDHNNPELPLNDDWLDEILGAQELSGEIGPDEHAVASAGLTHPDDLELERIVQETLAENWGSEEPTAEASKPEEQADATQLFEPQPEAQSPVREQPPETKAPEKPAEERKTRPKLKKGYGLFGLPHLVVTAVWLAIVVAIGVTVGRVLWVCAADLLAFGKEPQEVTITVTAEDDIASISEKLEKAGLVRYAELFELFASLTGKGENIEAGTFNFSGETLYDYNAIIKAMVNYGSSQEVVTIMFPEGYTCAQIFARLEEYGVCTVEDLEAYAAEGELDDYWFLEGIERGHKYCLEGYLAPDTYNFYVNDEPERVLEKFLDEFDSRYTDYLKQKFESLKVYLADKMAENGYGAAYIEEHQITFREVMILASIIEKETSSNLESYTIASVFYNRLTNQSVYPYLQSDATILYATDYYNAGELITDEQINASPFNTYTHTGLIPSPICNPGLNSMGAALSPQDTDYYFFIYDEKAGSHRFSRTIAEHEAIGKELGLVD